MVRWAALAPLHSVACLSHLHGEGAAAAVDSLTVDRDRAARTAARSRNLIGSFSVYVMEMGDQSSIDGVQAIRDAGALLRACAWCDRVQLDANWVEASPDVLALVDAHRNISHTICPSCTADHPQPAAGTSSSWAHAVVEKIGAEHD